MTFARLLRRMSVSAGENKGGRYLHRQQATSGLLIREDQGQLLDSKTFTIDEVNGSRTRGVVRCFFILVSWIAQGGIRRVPYFTRVSGGCVRGRENTSEGMHKKKENYQRVVVDITSKEQGWKSLRHCSIKLTCSPPWHCGRSRTHGLPSPLH